MKSEFIKNSTKINKAMESTALIKEKIQSNLKKVAPKIQKRPDSIRNGALFLASLFIAQSVCLLVPDIFDSFKTGGAISGFDMALQCFNIVQLLMLVHGLRRKSYWWMLPWLMNGMSNVVVSFFLLHRFWLPFSLVSVPIHENATEVEVRGGLGPGSTKVCNTLHLSQHGSLRAPQRVF